MSLATYQDYLSDGRMFPSSGDYFYFWNKREKNILQFYFINPKRY